MPLPHPELIASPLLCLSAACLSVWPPQTVLDPRLQDPALGTGNCTPSGRTASPTPSHREGLRCVVKVTRRMLRTVRRHYVAH